MSGSARQKAFGLPLSELSLAKTLQSLLPRINGFDTVNHAELLEELKLFGITNRRLLRALILRHRLEAIKIDRTPIDSINSKIQLKELGKEKFLYLQRRRIFLGWEGLVRVILELEFGDRYRAFSERRIISHQ